MTSGHLRGMRCVAAGVAGFLVQSAMDDFYFAVAYPMDGVLGATVLYASVRVVSQTATPPTSTFAEIPYGSFAMGDAFSEGEARERPVHTVTLGRSFHGRPAGHAGGVESGVQLGG